METVVSARDRADRCGIPDELIAQAMEVLGRSAQEQSCSPAEGFDANGDSIHRDPMEAVIDREMAVLTTVPGVGDGDPGGIPAMPTVPSGQVDVGYGEHRDKVAPRWFPFNACVARPVGKKERLATPAAQAA